MTENNTIHFLDPPPELRRRQGARFQILPVPFESTVSYGGGTANAPRAILQASQQVELFNGLDEPIEHGIFTHPLPETTPQDPAALVAQVKHQVREILREKAVPVVIGGEHTVTVGAFQACAEMVAPLGIVQFDAHADLRDTYEGTPFSHACVMRRACDLNLPVAQFGVRSLCREEVELRKKNGIIHYDGADLHRRLPPPPVLPEDFPENIYITFDIDALDAALVPATGTPEPGGLSWYTALDLLQGVMAGRRIVGFDLVELAPVPGWHASDYIAAKLIYAIIGLITRHGLDQE